VKSAFGAAESAGAKPRTDFSELKVPFTIKNGLFHTPNSNLQSPLLRLLAAGKADLVKETLDFRVEPKVVATIKGQGDKAERSGLMVPVLVSGTFDSPKFRPDLKAIAEQQIKEKVMGSGDVKQLIDKDKLMPSTDSTKGLLKGILGQ